MIVIELDLHISFRKPLLIVHCQRTWWTFVDRKLLLVILQLKFHLSPVNDDPIWKNLQNTSVICLLDYLHIQRLHSVNQNLFGYAFADRIHFELGIEETVLMVHYILGEFKSDVFKLDILGKFVDMNFFSFRDFVLFFSEHTHS